MLRVPTLDVLLTARVLLLVLAVLAVPECAVRLVLRALRVPMARLGVLPVVIVAPTVHRVRVLTVPTVHRVPVLSRVVQCLLAMVRVAALLPEVPMVLEVLEAPATALMDHSSRACKALLSARQLTESVLLLKARAPTICYGPCLLIIRMTFERALFLLLHSTIRDDLLLPLLTVTTCDKTFSALLSLWTRSTPWATATMPGPTTIRTIRLP